jgi:hypothetical protein
MDTPELEVARYAAGISRAAFFISALSACVSAGLLALQVRRWADEGVRLSLIVMADAVFFGGNRQDENTYISLTVTNRGSAPTTITHMILYHYPTWYARYLPNRITGRLKNQRPRTLIVPNPSPSNAGGQLPHMLEPGRYWLGVAKHTPELSGWIDTKALYVGVHGSHRDKPILSLVRRWKPPAEVKNL